MAPGRYEGVVKNGVGEVAIQAAQTGEGPPESA